MLGVFAGASWYMGDINSSALFYAPSPTGSAIFIYNFTKRWALRSQFGEINLHTATNSLDPYKVIPASFNAAFLQADSRIEFNFNPFAMVDRKHIFSAYVNAGLAYTIKLSGTAMNMPVFPFGAGIKYGLSRKLAIGAEWTAHMTFNDKLDNIISPGIDRNKPLLLHHNDWYTCVGVFFLYKIFDNPADCPVYKN